MQTRSYADLLSLIEALCGVSFTTSESAKIKALINRRAKRAYRATNFWPRFLVIGEEREVSDNLVPYTQDELDSIDTFLRIHVTAPWQSASAQEYLYSVGAGGALLIAGSSDPSSAFVTYKSTLPASYGDGGDETSEVPDEWFEYLAHGTYADFLRMEGQQEKAALADQEATEILTDELIRVDEQQSSSSVTTRILTYANTTNR